VQFVLWKFHEGGFVCCGDIGDLCDELRPFRTIKSCQSVGLSDGFEDRSNAARHVSLLTTNRVKHIPNVSSVNLLHDWWRRRYSAGVTVVSATKTNLRNQSASQLERSGMQRHYVDGFILFPCLLGWIYEIRSLHIFANYAGAWYLRAASLHQFLVLLAASLTINRAQSGILTELSPIPYIGRTVQKVYCGKMADWIRMLVRVVSGVGRGMGVLEIVEGKGQVWE